MASRENSKANSESTSELNILNNESLHLNVLASLPWDQPPLSWLTPEQKSRLQSQSEIRQYRLGEKIWSDEAGGYQFFIVAGKVRLRSEVRVAASTDGKFTEENIGKPLAALEAGDWFGDLQRLSLDCKAVAASKEVVVVCWETVLWFEISNPQIEEFWQGPLEDREEHKETFSHSSTSPLPPTSTLPNLHSSTLIIPNYPFVASWNTGAACLTMAAQQLENAVQLEWVQRQLRGQRPKHVVEAAEKLGLMLRRLQVNWRELRQSVISSLIAVEF